MAYDFHSHILPGIDDGSRSITQSLRMLDMLSENGVTDVVATPHFYINRCDVSTFLQRREKSFAALEESLEGVEHPRIYKGAEVYLTTGVPGLQGLEKLCIEDTNLMLIELPYGYWSDWVYRAVQEIIERHSVVPVIAHLDRYIAYIKRTDEKVIARLLDMNVKIQLNTSAVLEWRTKKRALRWIRRGYAHLLGTDCHNDKDRAPNMAKARQVIEKKCGVSKLYEIDENSRDLLGIFEY